MKAVIVLLVLCAAAPALASFCTAWSSQAGTTTTPVRYTCTVYLQQGQRIAAAVASNQGDLTSSNANYPSATGDTKIWIETPTSSPCTGTNVCTTMALNDDSPCGTLQSYIPYTCVPTTGFYTLVGSCYSTQTCSGNLYYQVTGTYSTATCFNSAANCNSGSSGTNGASSSSSGGSGAFTDVSNKGWAAPAALAAVLGITMIVCWALFSVRVFTDLACCGCAPTAADKRLPSILDSPVGSMHMHTFCVAVLMPLSMILVFVALCVDGYDVLRDQKDAMFGAFSAHQKSDKTTYVDLCPAQQGSVYTATNRMCPTLRAAGAMTFIAELLGLLAAVAALVAFGRSSPYAASGKTALSGGKPVIPRAACRLMEFASMSFGLAALMWVCAGHSVLVWFYNYVLSDSGFVQLGASWILLLIASIGMMFPAMVARREAVRDQPSGPAPGASAVPANSGVVPGAATNQPMQSQPPMQQPQQQNPYGGAVYGVPQNQYPAQPAYGQPSGYAPQYAPAGAPPAYGYAQPAPQAQMVVMQNQPAAVVRVPVQPPAGLALPPGAILYSNGDVCDAAGNVLGVVPGMRPQVTVIATTA